MIYKDGSFIGTRKKVHYEHKTPSLCTIITEHFGKYFQQGNMEFKKL